MNTFSGAHGPWLVAEIGGNHEGDFDAALRLADLAIEAGADAVKFQIYYGDTLVSAVESPDRNAHFKRFELTPDEHLAVAAHVVDVGCQYVASVWDVDAFGWIDPVVTAYKVGSGDLTAPLFLAAAAKTGRPMILSTGLSEMAEVVWAVEAVRAANPRYRDPLMLAVLQCTSMYPIAAADARLSVMQKFAEMDVAIGYSDHTMGTRALEIAAAMGAQVLEFHFTDVKEGRSFRDHQLSLDSADLADLIVRLDEIQTLKGAPVKEPLDIEIANDHVNSFRRAVYPSRDISAGEVLDSDNLCVLRPNHGIDARDYERLLGRRATRPLRRHERLDWHAVE
jgi:N,N'-diacetyllegionaminate synthase